MSCYARAPYSIPRARPRSRAHAHAPRVRAHALTRLHAPPRPHRCAAHCAAASHHPRIALRMHAHEHGLRPPRATALCAQAAPPPTRAALQRVRMRGAFARHRSLLILRALRTLLHISIADGAHLCGGAARRCSAARAAAVSSRARRSAMLPVTVPPSICTHARVIAASTAPTLLHRARRLRRQKRAALPRAHTDASRVIAHSCARSSSLCVSIASRRSRCGGRTAPQQQQPRAPQ